MSAEPVVTAVLDISMISDKTVRDILRRAAADTRHGTIWVIRNDGKRIAALVSVESAQFLAEIRGGLHEAERGETVDLGSFLGEDKS